MLKRTLLGISMATAAFSASASLMNFDSVQFTQFQANWNGYSLGNTNSYISALSTDYPGYGGLKWSYNPNINDFRIVKVDTATYASANPANGYTHGVVSGSWVATNGGGGDVWFESLTAGSKFNFESTYMNAAWYNGLKVDIAGYRDGVQVYSTTTGPLGFNAQLLLFNWANIDKVVFHSEQNSGTVIDNQSTYNHAFVMDNLVVTPVPAPESYALLLSGLGLMVGVARRRQA
jgi:hypothetical protein